MLNRGAIITYVTPTYTLRDAHPADIPKLVTYRVLMFEEMARQAGQMNDAVVMDRMNRDCNRIISAGFGAEHVGWLIEHEARPVAGAMVWLQPWLTTPKYPDAVRAYLHSVYTDPAHRGEGLARRLTEHAMEWCKAHGLGWLLLHASEQGRPLYESLGFEQGNEWQKALT